MSFRLLKFRPTGAVDTSFGESGILRSYFYGDITQAVYPHRFTITSDNKILVAGVLLRRGGYQIFLRKFGLDGVLEQGGEDPIGFDQTVDLSTTETDIIVKLAPGAILRGPLSMPAQSEYTIPDESISICAVYAFNADRTQQVLIAKSRSIENASTVPVCSTWARNTYSVLPSCGAAAPTTLSAAYLIPFSVDIPQSRTVSQFSDALSPYWISSFVCP
jgi:hypothetical protein